MQEHCPVGKGKYLAARVLHKESDEPAIKQLLTACTGLEDLIGLPDDDEVKLAASDLGPFCCLSRVSVLLY